MKPCPLLRLPQPVAVLGLCALLASGCAHNLTGKTDHIALTSVPSGARFVTNTGHMGVTPSTITVVDYLDIEVIFSMDGYNDQTIIAPSFVSNALWANLILWNPVAFIFDYALGNYREHQLAIHADLAEENARRSER